ncbi:MAG: exosortase/archaeosortase family protein [Phycisphaerales bacterium]|nr:exosortase/archaeosortase family protein [Phycisphaerales bacterium]
MSTSTAPMPGSSNTTQERPGFNPVMAGAFLAVLAIFIWLFWSFLNRQFRWALQEQADWGHTLVIPFIAGWFVYLNRQKIFAEPFRTAWTGLLLIIAGMGIYSISGLGPMMLRHHNIMGFGVGVTLFGLVLFFCGWRAMRWLWFPTLYLIVFGQTVSDVFLEVITYRLQDIAAVGSYYGLSLIGFDVERSGNTLQIFHQGEMIPVNIAEACSGMRMLVAFLALGVAMAYAGFSYRTQYPFLTLRVFFRRMFARVVGRRQSIGASTRRRAMLVIWVMIQRSLLVLLAIPTAVFVNILRVMTLGVLSTRDTDFAAGDFHTMVGLLWLIPAFFVYLGIMWVLNSIITDEEDGEVAVVEERCEIRFGSRTRLAFVVSVIVLVVGGAAFQLAAQALGVHLEKEPVAPRYSLDSIPYTVGSWSASRLSEQRMDESGVEELGTELYLTRRYDNVDDSTLPSLQLHIAYYTGHIDTIPHVPDRCLVAGGLTQEQPEPLNCLLEINEEEWFLDEENMLDGEPYRMATVKRPQGKAEQARLPVGDFKLRTTEFGDPTNPNLSVFAGYFFIANGRVTPDPWGVKLLAFKPEDKKAYFCKVQILAVTNEPLSLEEFIEVATSFLEPMIPEIARVLPDWVEVSAESEKDSA